MGVTGTRFRRIACALTLGALAAVVVASPAAAHISIQPESAAQGSDATLTFGVPNEMDNATTTKVQVKFPDDHPIADASVLAIPGWTFKVATKKLGTPVKTDNGTVDEGVDTITWTASNGQGIGVGEFQQFTVSVGLPSGTDALTFPTIQTYSNGQAVSWVETTAPGGSEPEHPAPVLKLFPSNEGASTTPATSASDKGNANVAASDLAKKSDVDSAKTISIIALIVGILGVLLGIGALVVARRRA